MIAQRNRFAVPQTDDALFASDTWSRSSQPTVAVDPLPLDSALDGLLLADDLRPRCAAPRCGREPKFWKKSARPVFDGHWTCGKSCTLALVQSSVRKQLANASPDPATAHRHRIPLGLVLLDQGAITHSQLQQALSAQRAAGHGRIGEWLDETCGITAEKITRGLAVQWNRPVLSTLGFRPERMALTMPETLRRELGLLPLRVAAGKLLYVAFRDQIDAAAVAVLERMTSLSVESGIVASSDYDSAERTLSSVSSIPCHEETVSSTADLQAAIVRTLFEHEPVASRLVAVRGQWWLRLWLERAAISRTGTLPNSSEDVFDFLFRA